MSYQCYIKCDDYYLFSCTYLPHTYKKVVLLLQGYSHSMTDIDYFMTNIRNAFLEQGFAVVQFDPYGHGDSDGQIEYFNYENLIKNIFTVTLWIKQNIGQDVIFFTRGLYTLTASDLQLCNMFIKNIFLNPLKLTQQIYNDILLLLSDKDTIIDFNDWFSNIPDHKKDMVESLFYSWGAKLKNLQGQYFNVDVFRDFLLRTYNRIDIDNGTNYYIFSNSTNEFNICHGSGRLYTHDINYYGKYNALPRDPDWHFKLIQTVVNLCLHEGSEQ